MNRNDSVVLMGVAVVIMLFLVLRQGPAILQPATQADIQRLERKIEELRRR